MIWKIILNHKRRITTEHFLESLKKLKKPSTHSNPEDVDPLFCRYNKGWNDAIEKVEKLFTTISKENKHE